jgi:hypothetical protein
MEQLPRRLRERGVAESPGASNPPAGTAAAPLREARPPLLWPLFQGLTELRGIGPQGARLLAELLGHETVARLDLLFHLPRGFMATVPLEALAETATGTVVIRAEIIRHRPAQGHGRPHRVVARVGGSARRAARAARMA